MLCNIGGGILDSASLELALSSGAGRVAGLATGFSYALSAGCSDSRSVGRSNDLSTGFSTGAIFSTGVILSDELDFLKDRGGGVSPFP